MKGVAVKSFASEKNDAVNFLYVGVDVHKDCHTAVITDCFGRRIKEVQVSNYDKDFESLVKIVRKEAKRENKGVVFGLEDSYSYGARLARFLYGKGFSVKMVPPVVVERGRKKETHPEKSDSLDAFGAALALIRRIGSLPNYIITKASDIASEMKALNLDREFLVKERTRLKNNLHELLHQSYNSKYKEMFKDTFSKKALRFWLEHPVDDKDTPASFVIEGRIKRKVSRLLDIMEEINEIESELSVLIKKSGQKLETMNGCGIVLTGMVLSEVRDIDRFRSPDALAKYAGLCPSERSSGKTARRVKTKSGNRRLNTAVHRIAICQIGRSGNEHAKEYFQRKITEGKSKTQALCCLKRRLINIIYMMLKYKEEYNYLKKT